MRVPALLLVLAACRSSPPAAAPPDAALAQTFVFRALTAPDSGIDSVLETFTLTVDGAGATLVMGAKKSPLPGNPEAPTIEAWQEAGRVSLTGSAAWQTGTLRLDFPRPDPGEPHLVLTCAERLVDVAPADAERVVPAGAPCDEPTRWSKPVAPTPLLVCRDGRPHEDELEAAFVFAPPPGVELVHVRRYHSECHDRAFGFRRVAPDGSVARLLPPPSP